MPRSIKNKLLSTPTNLIKEENNNDSLRSLFQLGPREEKLTTHEETVNWTFE